jgi:hypothetical protein
MVNGIAASISLVDYIPCGGVELGSPEKIQIPIKELEHFWWPERYLSPNALWLRTYNTMTVHREVVLDLR